MTACVERKEFFISYASEDAHVANALAKTLREIDRTFVVVNIDKLSLESGATFRTQLQDQLRGSEVLFVVHTDACKQAFGYTGWEVGYFEGVHGADSQIIPVYLTVPPATLSEREGINLDISTDDLRGETDLFKARLENEVNGEHPLVRFITEKRKDLARARDQAELGEAEPLDVNRCVRDMILSIFADWKNRPDTTVRPQKQITIRIPRGAGLEPSGDLPPEAEVVPIGAGAPMGVFGLAERSVSWTEFCAHAVERTLGQTWLEAIRVVLASSSPTQINVDNSRTILSPDGRIYRVILTSVTSYFNGKTEANLCLVEALRREDHGDPVTTHLLKGLELASRFRFLFLENDSRFYWYNLKLLRVDAVRAAANDLVAELNWLQRDARDAGMQEPSVWAGLVDWGLIERLSAEFRPRDERVRALCARMVAADTDAEVNAVRSELVGVVQDLEDGMRPHNGRLIVEMAGRLQDVVQSSDESRQGVKPRLVACEPPAAADVALSA